MTDTVTVEMALEQSKRSSDMALQLAEALDEARVLLIQVLGVAPGELEPPILKEQGDLAQAKAMSRKVLEEKYALSRMTARLSMKKAGELEGERDALAEWRRRHEAAQAHHGGRYWEERCRDAEDQREALANRVDFLNQQNSALAEQVDELEIQTAQLSARLVESDVERDKLAAKVANAESEQKTAHNEAISQESEQKSAHFDQGASR